MSDKTFVTRSFFTLFAGLAITAVPLVFMYYAVGAWYTGTISWWLGIPAMAIGMYLQQVATMVIQLMNAKVYDVQVPITCATPDNK